MKWQFEKFIGNTALNYISIAKYTNDAGEIKVIAEKGGKPLGKYGQKYSRRFENSESYSKWIDRNTDEPDLFYNGAQVVNDLLTALGYIAQDY